MASHRLAVPGDPAVALPSVWLDDDVVQVVRYQPDPVAAGVPTGIVLYECTVPAGTCHEAASPPPLDGTALPVFPDGRWYDPSS